MGKEVTMGLIKRRKHEMPGLNMAAMPDLIFTVLFFFMIVTHMRETELKVQYQMPQGTQLEKLEKKADVAYLYIGKPTLEQRETLGDSVIIQLNDRIVGISEIAEAVKEERRKMSDEDAAHMTVALRADRKTEMGVIQAVKNELRKAGALRINYSAYDLKEDR